MLYKHKLTMKTNYLKLGLAVLLCTTLACSKTKLKNEYAPLVGKWKWVYSIGGYSGRDIVTPSSIGHNYTLVFCKRGNYKICASNTLRNTNGRVKIEDNVITFIPNITTNKKTFFLDLERFYIKQKDTLELDDLSTDSYGHIFVKIN